MEKEFLPYTESLELKEIGFNEPCFKVGNSNGVIFWRFMDVVGMEGVGIDNLLEVEFDDRWVGIPTYSQTFRWFREKYRLSVLIHYCLDDYIGEIVEWTLTEDKIIHEVPNRIETNEEAELECLKKLIEIVKDKEK